MNKNNRITYRFDRTGQTIEDNGRKEINAKPQPAPEREQGKPSNIVPLYAKTEYETAESPFSPWMSPFQEDVGALEDLIRDTEPKPAQAAEKNSASPVVLPATKPSLVQDAAVYDSRPETGPSAKQPQRPAQWHPRQKVQPSAALPESMPQSEPKPVQPEPHAVPAQTESDAWGELQHYPELEVDLNNNGQKANRWSGPVHNYSAPPSWIKVFLSVAGALATGALFGYLLLSLFTNAPDQSDSNNKLANPVNGTVTNPSASPNGDKTNTNSGTSSPATNQTAAGRVKLNIPLQSYQLLQYGVFSNTEGRDAAIKELTDKGLAAAGLQTANDYRVYAGMAIDRERALALSNDLGEDIPVYIKQIDVQVPEQFPFAGDAKAATAFMNNTIGLISMLDELTLTQLEQPSLSPLSSAAAESWQAEHQQWTESVKAMQAGVTDESGKAFLIKLIQSMNTAAKSLEEYDKKPSQSHLWAVQDALMDAVVTQKQWYESINAL